MSSATIRVPQSTIERRDSERLALLGRATEILVTDDSTYRAAGELALAIAQLRKSIVDDFAPAKKAAHDAHRAICAQEKKHLDALAEPDRLVRQKLGAYAAEQERRRQDAEREAIRLAQEQAREKVITEAVKAEQRGDVATAERILNGPVIPEAVAPVTIARPQAAGVAMVSVTRFQITDANLIPREFMSPDEKKIRGYVNTFGAEAVIPGVRVWAEQVPRIGGRILGIKPADERILAGGADYADRPKPVQSAPEAEAEEAAENIWG